MDMVEFNSTARAPIFIGDEHGMRSHFHDVFPRHPSIFPEIRHIVPGVPVRGSSCPTQQFTTITVMHQAIQQPIAPARNAPDRRRPRISACTLKYAWKTFPVLNQLSAFAFMSLSSFSTTYTTGRLKILWRCYHLGTIETTGIRIQRHYSRSGWEFLIRIRMCRIVWRSAGIG